MSDSVEKIDMSVSDSLFRLTTESIRVLSNERHEYVAIGDVVNAHAARMRQTSPTHTPKTAGAHLAIIKTDGDIPIHIEIRRSSYEDVLASAEILSHVLATSVRFADAISVLLFDFIAERETMRLAARLGLRGKSAEEHGIALAGSRDSIEDER